MVSTQERGSDTLLPHSPAREHSYSLFSPHSRLRLYMFPPTIYLHCILFHLQTLKIHTTFEKPKQFHCRLCVFHFVHTYYLSHSLSRVFHQFFSHLFKKKTFKTLLFHDPHILHYNQVLVNPYFRSRLTLIPLNYDMIVGVLARFNCNSECSLCSLNYSVGDLRFGKLVIPSY